MAGKLKILFPLLFFVYFMQINAQVTKETAAFKKAASEHMNAGRYGEAIELLNKYISANPSDGDGYNLRGLCFEKRSQYSEAVLDFRRAIKVETDQKKKDEYSINLQRVIDVWYALLNKKIQGHLREIAINPNNPYNYLEIGKSYRAMEMWDKAEQWYDEYLKRDDNASPDEIIRYTEILAKTGNITKGEKILKKYVDRYPQDWRLWSRYGYFTLWLGKYKIAKSAFETALGFKPFFQEALDGLDLANKQAYVTQYVPRSFEKEFPIDRYYRILRENPDDLDTRFKLVDELIKAERIEEAYQQLMIIGVNHSDDPRYQEKWDYVTNFRDKTYTERIAEYNAKLQKDSTDIDALKKLAQYYEYLQNYDTAYTVLQKYFTDHPDEKDPELRFRYARICAWVHEFDQSLQIVDGLLQDYPDNLDYQLFRAQVSIWNKRDIELARTYLQNVLEKRPDDVDALIAMGSLKIIDNDFDAAQEYADKAKSIDPTNNNVIKLQSNIDFQKLRYEEEKLYAILEQGRTKVVDGDCEGALSFYQDYLAKAEPNDLILKEYGDVQFCAKHYQEAANIYDQVLNNGYNYDAALQRAKVSYAMGDSLDAVKRLRVLVNDEPEEFEPRLYLGDSYSKLGENDSARAEYDTLLSWKLDSTQVKMVQLRKGWLPVTGLSAIFESFPNYVGLAPTLNFYSDNLSFRLTSLGSRLELGFTSYLSFGVTFLKTYLKANQESLADSVISTLSYFTGDRSFTTFKGHVFLRLSPYFTAGAGAGNVNSKGEFTRNESDAFINYERKDTVQVNLTYTNTDAVLIMYSPYLIDYRLYAALYKAQGYYVHKNGLKFAGYYSYVKLNDDNEGNDFQFRIGRKFADQLYVGYEYFYSNYKLKSDYYYSPTNFESHSIWIESSLEDNKELQVTLGGKLGYIPSGDFVALGANVDTYYKPSKSFTFQGRLAVGSTSRDNSSYKYLSIQLSAYWNIF